MVKVFRSSKITIATWGTLSDNITAVQNASAFSGGNMSVNITATKGTATADSSGTGNITLHAGQSGEASSFGPLVANMNTGTTADVFSYGSALVDIVSGGDATLTTGDWLGGTVNSGGSIDALSMGELSGTYTAAWDASVVTAQDIATATITAGDDASAIAWSSASGMDVEGKNDAFAFSYGTMDGTVHSSAGTAEAFSAGTGQVTVNAATVATLNGLSDLQAQVTAGTDGYVFAGGLLTGSLTTGEDAYATSYGVFELGVNATGNATVSSIGNMQTSVQAGQDLWAISYGTLDAEPFTAGNAIQFVGAVGDITGNLQATNVIQRIASYAGINASISAGDSTTNTPGSIWLVEAYDAIAGTISATNDVDLVRSAHAITATITAPSVGTPDANDPQVMSNLPVTPSTSLASIWAELAGDYLAVQAGKGAMAASLLAETAVLLAGQAAAADQFQVSMGSLADAQAVITEAVAQLNGSIGQIVSGVNQALSAAATGQQTAWAAITSQVTAAQVSFNLGLDQAKADADKTESQLLNDVIDNILIQTDAYSAAVDVRTKILADRNNERDNERADQFNKLKAELNSQWWHGTFFVAGFLPGIGDAADWLDTIYYAMEGKWDEAGTNLVFALIPIVSRSMFKGAQGAGQAIGEINSVRHAATNGLGNVAQSGMRFAGRNVDDIGSTVGRISHQTPSPNGICWLAGESYNWQPLPQKVERVELVTADYSGWLVSSLIIGAGLAGWRLDERRKRKRFDQAMIDALFNSDGDEREMIDDDDQMYSDLARRHAQASLCRERSPGHSAVRGVDSLGAHTARELCLSDATAVACQERATRRGSLAKAKSPRGYLGTAWLAFCLIIATLVGWRYSPQRLSEPSRQAAASAVSAPRYGLLRVEDAEPGQRLVSRNPDMTSAGSATKVDPRTWRLVRLHSEKRWPDGTLDTVEVKTLQPPEWLDQHEVVVGREVPIPLDLAEMGLPEDMQAQVIGIEPCPRIQDGPGHVILTTVSHLNNALYTLTLENTFGKRETVHPTGLHKLRRADGEWVSVEDLKGGDCLAGLSGDLIVTSLERLPGVHRVYNCTVEDQHVYNVGELGLLAHNMGCKISLQSYGGPGGGHHIPAKSAFNGASGYNAKTALAISNRVLKQLGLEHSSITGAQMTLYTAFAKKGKALTWKTIEDIETKALVRAGADARRARAAVKEAIQALKKAGVTGPTRIPWGG